MTNRLWTQQRMCGHANRPQTHATGVWLRGLSVGAAIGVDRQQPRSPGRKRSAVVVVRYNAMSCGRIPSRANTSWP